MHSDAPVPEGSLKFSLELKGPSGGNIISEVCNGCMGRMDQATWDIVDFRRPTTTVAIENSTASLEFFIKCYAKHHNLDHFR